MGDVNFKNLRVEERVIAGITVPVTVTPRIQRSGPIARILFGMRSLARGMRLTLGYFTHPSTVVTQQYPENRATLTFPERYRASLRFVEDESGYHRCTGCGICEKSCPNGSIMVSNRKGGVTGQREVDSYVWRMDSCTFCNACVEVCPSCALEMGPEFENAVFDRRLLIYNLNKYAGPTDKQLANYPDPEQRKEMIEPRKRYDGPVPLNGAELPDMKPMAGTGKPDAPASPGATDTPPEG